MNTNEIKKSDSIINSFINTSEPQEFSKAFILITTLDDKASSNSKMKFPSRPSYQKQQINQVIEANESKLLIMKRMLNYIQGDSSLGEFKKFIKDSQTTLTSLGKSCGYHSDLNSFSSRIYHAMTTELNEIAKISMNNQSKPMEILTSRINQANNVVNHMLSFRSDIENIIKNSKTQFDSAYASPNTTLDQLEEGILLSIETNIFSKIIESYTSFDNPIKDKETLLIYLNETRECITAGMILDIPSDPKLSERDVMYNNHLDYLNRIILKHIKKISSDGVDHIKHLTELSEHIVS